MITPVHSRNHRLPVIRKSLSSAIVPIQIIIVVNNQKLVKEISPKTSNEEVVFCSRRGRGYAFLEGISNAKGDIALLLHSDTNLPSGWDAAILSALEDTRVVGGGFSLSYDTSKPTLEIITWLSNLWVWLSGELYGDRAMFVRSDILKRCLSVLQVPIFEDLRLTRCMHKHGRVVLLGQEIITSAEKYRKYGLIGYILRIWSARILYMLGIDPHHVYASYYSE